MLLSIEGDEIDCIPHEKDFRRWRRNLADEDYEAIIDEFHRIMDEKTQAEVERGERAIFKSSFIPGADWSDTVFQPIYIACRENWDLARQFFGLLLWESVQTHSETWFFMKDEREDGEPTGTFYFRAQ